MTSTWEEILCFIVHEAGWHFPKELSHDTQGIGGSTPEDAGAWEQRCSTGMDVSQGHCCGGTVGTGLAQLWQSPLVCRGTLSSWGFPTSFGAEVWGSHWPVPGRDLGGFSAPAGPGLVPESVWNCFQDLTPLLPKRSHLFSAQNFSGVLSGPAGAPCLLGVGSDPFCPLVFSIHFPHGTRLQTLTGQCRRGLRGICLASSHEQPGALLQGLGSPWHCHRESKRKPLPSSSPQPSSRFMAEGHASFLAEQMGLRQDALWVQAPDSPHLHSGASVRLSLGNGLQSSDNCTIRCPAYLRHLT